jgi:hypothetical protein
MSHPIKELLWIVPTLIVAALLEAGGALLTFWQPN